MENTIRHVVSQTRETPFANRVHYSPNKYPSFECVAVVLRPRVENIIERSRSAFEVLQQCKPSYP
jgi:hypothetical protein